MVGATSGEGFLAGDSRLLYCKATGSSFLPSFDSRTIHSRPTWVNGSIWRGVADRHCSKAGQCVPRLKVRLHRMTHRNATRRDGTQRTAAFSVIGWFNAFDYCGAAGCSRQVATADVQSNVRLSCSAAGLQRAGTGLRLRRLQQGRLWFCFYTNGAFRIILERGPTTHPSSNIHLSLFTRVCPPNVTLNVSLPVFRLIITARSELRKVLFLALSFTFLFMYEISLEPLNRFTPNSHGRRVWSLARASLNVKVKGIKPVNSVPLFIKRSKKLEAKDVLRNINRTQAVERVDKCRFLPLVALTWPYRTFYKLTKHQLCVSILLILNLFQWNFREGPSHRRPPQPIFVGWGGPGPWTSTGSSPMLNSKSN